MIADFNSLLYAILKCLHSCLSSIIIINSFTDNYANTEGYAAVRQRIDINCVLPHLDRSETESYIQSHLTYAAGRIDIFTDKALDEIHKESSGIPRRINRIAEKSLMYAFQQSKRLIDEHMVRYVVEHEMLQGGGNA